MEIKAGDYVRSTESGQLHFVQFVSDYGINTVRVHDNKRCVILTEHVQKVDSVSNYPGQPETTTRRAL